MKYRCCNLKPVPCELCGKPTNMTATRRCDRCWELEHRIKADPELAQKILDQLIGWPFPPTAQTFPREIDNR